MASARLREVAGDLRADRDDLERILGEGRQCLADLSGREPTSLEVRGAGDIVHDFYNAVEHFLERVAVEMNGGLPAGPDSHAQLLRRMSRAVEDVRPAIVDAPLCTRLQDYLRFRHLFRHGYGYALQWPRLVPLLDGMQALAPELRRQLDGFIHFVEGLAERLDPS